jgi:hypothetical protein
MTDIRLCLLEPAGGISFPRVATEGPGLHDLLGGYMEPFPLPRHLIARDLLALADEEGNLKQLPYNVYSPLLSRQIVGKVLIVRQQPPEFVSLTDEDVEILEDWFGMLITIEEER